MRKLLNTLYVTSPDAYLSLDGECVVVLRDSEVLIRIPLLNLEAITTFGYTGASPALLGACAERKIALNFMTGSGRFLASVTGVEHGNVTLRRTQYRVADDELGSLEIARNVIVGKLYNSRWLLERAVRDHEARLDADHIRLVAHRIADAAKRAAESKTAGELRGIEGEAASSYFSVFDDLILQNKEEFYFRGRSRRPPLDNVNALLSFMYALLSNDISAALSAVGLDPFVGFFHTDRPGRRSLALDLLEELRAPLADRFVLTLVNTKQLSAGDFLLKESGAVQLRDDARKSMLTAWQNRKKEQITHPYLREKLEWGLVPHAQALLLARFLRGDIDAYPPFMWK
ncbi:MAG: type I-C CRISPR-associated endonuclease Cas1c [Oscillospiraceae bacterium]|nr:type I-C CRISPR-associated endonuclease Cas1c [Oscillospiraceae bacterium]